MNNFYENKYNKYKFKYKKLKTNMKGGVYVMGDTLDPTDMSCCICLHTLNYGNPDCLNDSIPDGLNFNRTECVILQCNHILHTHCCNTWAHNNPICPECKKSIAVKKYVKIEAIDNNYKIIDNSNNTLLYNPQPRVITPNLNQRRRALEIANVLSRNLNQQNILLERTFNIFRNQRRRLAELDSFLSDEEKSDFSREQYQQDLRLYRLVNAGTDDALREALREIEIYEHEEIEYQIGIRDIQQRDDLLPEEKERILNIFKRDTEQHRLFPLR
jgi:hypothetical protein